MSTLPGRPAADEYQSFYAGYVAEATDDDVVTLLETQMGDTLALFRSIDEAQALHRYADGKWSMKEVLGHIVDGERVFAFRAFSFARGESQELPGFEEDDYVAAANSDQRTLPSLLDECESARRASLALFRSFGAKEWMGRGTANGSEVSVRALAFIMAGHEAHHLRVLRERYLG